MDQIDSSSLNTDEQGMLDYKLQIRNNSKIQILRILDLNDDMDHELIQIEKYKKNMKFYYDIILECDFSPEEFFQIARQKNMKMETQLQQDIDPEQIKKKKRLKNQKKRNNQ